MKGRSEFRKCEILMGQIFTFIIMFLPGVTGPGVLLGI